MVRTGAFGRMVRPAWGWSTGKRRLDARQRAGERVSFRAREIGQKRRKALAQQLLRRAERLPSTGRERDGYSAAVLGELAALEQPGVGEAREQLRYRRARDASALSELRA